MVLKQQRGKKMHHVACKKYICIPIPLVYNTHTPKRYGEINLTMRKISREEVQINHKYCWLSSDRYLGSKCKTIKTLELVDDFFFFFFTLSKLKKIIKTLVFSKLFWRFLGTPLCVWSTTPTNLVVWTEGRSLLNEYGCHSILGRYNLFNEKEKRESLLVETAA